MKPYCAEDKLKIIKEVTSGGESVYSVCRRYSISRVTFYRWLSLWRRAKKNRLNALQNRANTNHYRSLSYEQQQAILRLVHKKPEYSCHTLAKTLAIGHHGVQNVLQRYSLNTFDSRRQFAQSPYWKRLSVQDRVEMMELYQKGWKQVEICKHFNISKNSFNKWKHRYLEGAASGGQLLGDRYLKGSSHPKSLTKSQEQVVLQTVRSNPNLSVHKMHQKLAGIVGHHGIQNTLVRFGYNMLSKRLEYAREFLAAPIVKIAPLYQNQMPQYSLRMLLAPFASIPKLIFESPGSTPRVLLLRLFPFAVLFLWLRVVFGTSGASPVGLLFASIALFFGLFFFIYSINYYVSILLVLKIAQSGSTREVSAA